MRTAIRYGLRLGCLGGTVHDPVTLSDTPRQKIEKCKICSVRKNWLKGYKGRIDNVEYLKFHVRSFAQRNGTTKRVYAKIYDQQRTIIRF